ncbi:tail fiber domain-containing protein [Robinsoniella sp. KNHs210]|uniref:tail fiber domain-containing protein n=1 Tax=Robinsoniella sp. KNHs210 TaxID=1469950 RepID=UPI00048989BC|nr:tail fiber domain-containing protein [Robinsoniella sp. KNHs210]
MELTPEALNVVAKYINLNGDVKVSGNMLVDGAITAPKIAAKAITADKIAIGDFTNYAQLNVDTLSKWGFTSVDDTSASANPWFKRNNITRDCFISEWYPCNGGESFRIKADIKTTVKGSSTNGGTDSDFKGVTVGVYCYSNTNAISIYYAQRVTNQTQSISSAVTLNSNIRKFAVFVQIEGWAPFTGELFVRNVQVTKMSTGELIVDGSVTADKMNVKGLTVSDGSKNTLAIDNAGNVSLDVKSLRITGSAAATQSEAQGYASSAKSEAISAAASDASTKANNAKTDALNAAKTYTDNGLGSKLDTSWMTQKNVFDKLTNNGSLQGIYMEGGKLYINGEYIKANSIDADRLIVGMNPNLVRYGLDTMEQYSTVPNYLSTSGTTITLDSTQYYCGTKSIKVLGTTSNNYICLGNSTNDFGCVPVTAGKKYIISCYVRHTTTSRANVTFNIVGHTEISSNATTSTASFSDIVTNTDGWKRLVIKYTATSTYPYISLRIATGSSNIPVWFDAFQIEEVDDLGKEPGAFKQAGTTIINGENITTGTISDALGNISWNLASGVLNAKKLSIDSINFKLTEAGVVTAKSGIIGGWNITPESMNRQFTANNKNYWLYFDTGTTTDAYAAFMLRTKATTASAWEDKFSIAWNGKMTAMDADVRGKITATSGSFNGTIEAQIINILNKMSIYYNDLGVKKLTSVIEIPNRTSEGAHSDLMIGGDTSYLTLKASDQIRSYTPLNIMNSIMEYGVSLSNKYQAKGSYSASNHTHTAAQVGAATATHSHSAAQIGAAESSHQHGQLHQDGKAVVTTSNGGTIFRAAEVRGNNVVTLGSSTYKWTRLWAVQGTISTSDRNEKTNIEPLDERYEKLFMDLKPKMFNWKNFTNKDHHDRRHCGLIAQDVEDATYANGLSPELFAAVCKDNLEKPTEDGRNWSYGLIYSELHGLEIHMIQKNIAETFELKSQIMSLRNENDNLKSINDEIIKRLEKIEKIIDVF